MPISKLHPSFTLTEDRLKELQAVVPEAFADGRINWDTLREALGETLEDESQEHFGLFWPGKREARRLAAMPSKGTLVPQPGEGVDEDNTHNLFIEGENLEVLKLLQKSYAGKVKVIYIDPPYNTGEDFIYQDKFTESIENYLQRTNQIDEYGTILTSNLRGEGRYHSNWLNMMLPRMLLAHKLLRPDGVFFVSIGEHEAHNLRILLNEIFGEENYITTIARVAKTASDKGNFFAPSIDFVLCYAKQKDFLGGFADEVDVNLYKKEDENGKFRDDIALYQSALDTRPNQRYYIECPDGSKVIPPGKTFPPEKPKPGDGVWRWTEETRMKNKDLLVFKETKTSPLLDENGKKARYNIYTKSYLKVRQEKGTRPRNFVDEFYNRKGADYLKTLGLDFSYSKPYQLILWLLEIVQTESNDIIIDFFAGSGTTADAVMRLNRKDGKKRNFILTDIPEPVQEKSAFRLISDVAKERIRRVILDLTKSDKSKLKLELPKEDLGFKCYRLDRSSFMEWQLFTDRNTSQLELKFEQSETPLVEDWQPENLLAEILLLQGFPLDSNVRSLPEFKGNDIQQVTSEFVTHPLYVCLDKKIKPETVSKLKLGSEDIFACLDSALSDEAKVKLADQCNLKVI